MDKKEKIKRIVSDAERTAKNIINKTTQKADQNADGKFDRSDVSIIAENIETAVKQGTQKVKIGLDEKAKEIEIEKLKPLFPETLESIDFHLSKFIRITERSKKYKESEVCKGSIGYKSIHKGFEMINIFRDSISAFNLQFYPDHEYEFYYIDPTDKNLFIALDEYFYYLKSARINELEKIAQDLGAKHIKITYMEEKTSFSGKKAKAQAKIEMAAKIEANHNISEKEFSTTHIEKEMNFPGHSPLRPQLKYLHNDLDILSLISKRMDEKSATNHENCIIVMSKSSDIKKEDAIKIDAIIKVLKCKGNATVESEVSNEERRYLMYDIEF